MKLVLLISQLSAGGAERVLSNLANYWVGKGHDVTLVTLSKPDVKPFYHLDPGVQLIQLGLLNQSQNPLFRLFHIVNRLRLIRSVLNNMKPDRIISFMDVMNITTLIASAGLRIPVIVCERIDPNYHKIPGFYDWLRYKLYPLAHRVLCQTKNSAAYFSNLKTLNSVILPNAIERPKNRVRDIAENVTQILSTGRLVFQKDHATLIQAFSKISGEFPEISLTIYGEGEERENLENLIQALNLQGRVFLPGTTQEITKRLIESDLFVFPSRFEGFPNALCEAMAVGLPVIASACSGNTDVVRDGVDGLLFPIGDVNRLTELMRSLTQDPTLRQTLSQNAKEITDRFSEKEIYAKWDQVIL